jgi:hypothetical protein
MTTVSKRLYAQRRADRICTRCGKFDAAPHKAQCLDCTEYQRTYELTRDRRVKPVKRGPVARPRPLLTELPAPGPPLGVARPVPYKPAYLRQGWCPQAGSIALAILGRDRSWRGESA